MTSDFSSNSNFDTETIAGSSRLFLDSGRIEECFNFFQTKQIDNLIISAARGFKLNNLRFLENFPFVRRITIVPPPSGLLDITAIQALAELRSLTISGEIDFPLEQFRKLETFSGYWTPRLELANCRNLKTLDLCGFSPKSKNLTELPRLELLTLLSLVRTTITALDGISKYIGLNGLELAYASKLKNIDELSALRGLDSLCFENCKKIENVENISKIKTLRHLKLIRCGSLKDIKFINDLPCLDEFRFVGTEVIDGDLSSLTNIKWVGFDNKKHYSISDKDLDLILREKGGGAVVQFGDRF